MKYLPSIAGVLLGLLFIAGGVTFFVMTMPEMPFPPGSPPIKFMEVMGPTGYMAFVKVLEIVGGLLVMIPRTRNFGLLVLGPIIVNILAFSVFVAGGKAVLQPPVIIVAVLGAYLLWSGRKAFAGLGKR